MDDKFFEEIRLKAINNIISRCPPEKRETIGNKLYEQFLIMASTVCSEMLKEYHSSFASSQKSDKAR